MNPQRRQVLNKHHNDIPEYDHNIHIFGRIKSCISGDLFEVDIIDPNIINQFDNMHPHMVTVPARLPTKYRNVIYTKTGDIVLLAPLDNVLTSMRAAYSIDYILTSAHLLHFTTYNILPYVFRDAKLNQKAANNVIINNDNNNNSIGTSRLLSSPYSGGGGVDSDDELPANMNVRKKRGGKICISDSSDDDDDDDDSDNDK